MCKILRVVKNVTWRQRTTSEVLYARLPRISTAISERCLRFRGHCQRSKHEVVSDLVLWEPKHGKRSVGGQASTLILSICWRRTPGSPETTCRQRWLTGLAGADLVVVIVVVVVVVVIVVVVVVHCPVLKPCDLPVTQIFMQNQQL